MGGQEIDSFLKKAEAHKLSAGHVSLFVALYVLSRQVGPGERFRISRRLVMPMARISSPVNYHRKLRDLVSVGIVAMNLHGTLDWEAKFACSSLDGNSTRLAALASPITRLKQ